MFPESVLKGALDSKKLENVSNVQQGAKLVLNQQINVPHAKILPLKFSYKTLINASSVNMA